MERLIGNEAKTTRSADKSLSLRRPREEIVRGNDGESLMSAGRIIPSRSFWGQG